METIYTIPVNESFTAVAEDKSLGCPVCRLYNKLEEDELERILGAAMMEPDVRIETNELGFCDKHFERMYKKKNRLGLALMLESHLDEVIKKAAGKGLGALKGGPAAESVRKLTRLEASCYICDRIEMHLSHMIETILFLYESDKDFRRRFAETPYFCLPHYRRLVDVGAHKMSKRIYKDFYTEIAEKENEALTELRKDVSWFCKKFDYRYEEEPWYNAKDAVERAIRVLSGASGENK